MRLFQDVQKCSSPMMQKLYLTYESIENLRSSPVFPSFARAHRTSSPFDSFAFLFASFASIEAHSSPQPKVSTQNQAAYLRIVIAHGQVQVMEIGKNVF